MRILVACEESQIVTVTLRKLGHEAYSCDIIECSGGYPEWHIKRDAISVIYAGGWDMIIAHPPCTYLTVAGNRSYSLRLNPPDKVAARLAVRDEALRFVLTIANAPCNKIAIENPVGYLSRAWRKPDQIIQPYQFGDAAMKRTCLWLKGLPLLTPTNVLPKPEPLYICQGDKSKGKRIGWSEGMRGVKGGQAERSRARSKTFPGIAAAMATQWGGGKV